MALDRAALPAALSVAQWERQAGAAAKARPTTVSDALAALHKLAGAIDFDLFDTSRAESLEALAAARTRADAEAERRVKPAVAQGRALGAVVRKWLDAVDKKDASTKPAQAAAAVVSRAAADYVGALEQFLAAAMAAFDDRRKELEQAQKSAAAAPPKPSPERLRLRTRLIDRFRVVKMRPDQKVLFLLCIGNRSAAPFLGSSVSDSNKPLLVKALKGDTGFKFFRGEVLWEDGAYTFVGMRMNNTLARRIENGILQLTGTRYRIRAREGKVERKGKDEDA
jgi:hypothetical protein